MYVRLFSTSLVISAILSMIQASIAQKHSTSTFGQGHTFRAPTADVVHRLRRDAESGSRDAQYQIGLLYYYGDGVAVDRQIAYRYFKDAALQGHPQASGNLGSMLEQGEGVHADPSAAFAYYKRAGEDGEPEGLFRAGLMLYEEQVPGYEEHERLADAHALFLRARQAGHPDATFYLAVILEYGLHLPQNFTEAGHLYAECCEPASRSVLGDPDCCFHGALLHAYGRGFSQDFGVAIRGLQICMQVAAARGGTAGAAGSSGSSNGSGASSNLRPAIHGPCALYLGLLHGAGQGVPVDYEAARVYLQQAAESGDPRAEAQARTAYANIDKLLNEAESSRASVLSDIAAGHAAAPPEHGAVDEYPVGDADVITGVGGQSEGDRAGGGGTGGVQGMGLQADAEQERIDLYPGRVPATRAT